MLSALLLASAVQSTEMRLMRMPTISGDTIVFVYGGDLWSTSKEGGLARRLTSSVGTETAPRISPDGKWIAFTATYDGNPDVYVIPIEGGDPKRLTFDASQDVVRGWTPDGKIAYISPGAGQGGFTTAVKFLSPQGGFPTETRIAEATDLAFSPDGKTIAFNRANSHNFNWRRYRGGTQGRISFSDAQASFYKEIPSGRENRWQPMYVGNDLYYICDKVNGTRNLFKYSGGKESQVTDYKDADIKWPSTDGKTIVYERNGFLEALDIASSKTSRVNCRLAGDLNLARPFLANFSSGLDNFSLSPSGSRIAVTARGELFSVPARSGETRGAGGDSSSRESNPAWSPDGNTIAFLSDKSGEDKIYTMPQMGGDWKEVKTPANWVISRFSWSPNGKKLSIVTDSNALYVLDVESGATDLVVQSDLGFGGFDWSPDSNWITYANVGKNLFGAIWLYDVNAKKSTQVTEGYYNDSSPVFDQTGKFLFFVSSRTFNPAPSDFEYQINMVESQRVYALQLQNTGSNPMSRPGDEEPGTPPPGAGGKPEGQEGPPPPPAGPKPIQVDFEGLAARIIPLPWPAGEYSNLAGIPGGVLAVSGGTLKMFDFNMKAGVDVAAPVFGYDLNPRRNKIAIATIGGISIQDLRPGLDLNAGRVNLGNCTGMLNPRAEWTQMYWQAWRWERDRYYDKNMLGLDWKAIGKQYADYLPYVSSRSDLSYVLGQMIGELGTGHAYVQGGDPGPTLGSIPVGMLGADYEVSSGHIRFKKILRGLNFEEARRSPLGDPGVNVKEGDYLLEIDGADVGANSPSQFLQAKVGKTVKLLVNSSPSKSGARSVIVRPIGSEQQLRYIEWVESRRKLVAELSGGKIGYLHVPDTSQPGMIEFAKGFYSQSDKSAMIVDERFNGGGMIPTFFIEKLARNFTSMFRQRNGSDVGFPTETLDMPKAMLINEYAGSGGDLFPYLFRKAGLGPLIGNRTWGGLVGITGGAPLTDGGSVTAPEFGLYDPDTGKWIAENTGIDPDIAVDNNPASVAAGEDAQIKKAVDYLLAEIKKGRKPVKRPDFPRIKVGG